jgi:hypothetical protein
LLPESGETNGRTTLFGICGDFDFCVSAQNLLLNNKCVLRRTKIQKCKGDNNLWKFTYNGRIQIRKIYEYMYGDATIWLDRKRETVEKCLK